MYAIHLKTNLGNSVCGVKAVKALGNHWAHYKNVVR